MLSPMTAVAGTATAPADPAVAGTATATATAPAEPAVAETCPTCGSPHIDRSFVLSCPPIHVHSCHRGHRWTVDATTPREIWRAEEILAAFAGSL